MTLDKQNTRTKVGNQKNRMKVFEVVIFVFLVLLFMVTLVIIWSK
jgi:hypothetical protein